MNYTDVVAFRDINDWWFPIATVAKGHDYTLDSGVYLAYDRLGCIVWRFNLGSWAWPKLERIDSPYKITLGTDLDFFSEEIRLKVDGVVAMVIQTQERQIRDGLIALGWTPPAECTGGD